MTRWRSLGRRPRKKKTRRWFKGVGQIVKGAAMAVTDIGAVAGLLPIAAPMLEQLPSPRVGWGRDNIDRYR